MNLTMERQEFMALMTDAMRGDVEEDLFGGRLAPGRVKSRLLEAHPAEHSPDGTGALLRSIGERLGARVDAAGESLWALTTDEHVFFVDSLNARFWLLHTTAPANVVRRLVRRELLTDARLDTAWLPSDQLNRFEGQRHWVKSSFTSDELLPVSGEAAGPTRRWRVQVEGDAPEELLNLVRTDPRFASAASLTAVGSWLTEPGIGEASVIADYRGGFVATGTSFELVAGALWRTLDRYEAYVESLEATYQLRTERVGELGLTIDGEVAVIDFPSPLVDLDRFVAGLFTSKEPFRLWAVPRQIDEEQWEANAVDLHVGQTLRLEVTPRWLRVLLGEHTCGNTLARLITNLQHRFNAESRLADTQSLVA
jgi:hypothetical protein